MAQSLEEFEDEAEKRTAETTGSSDAQDGGIQIWSKFIYPELKKFKPRKQKFPEGGAEMGFRKFRYKELEKATEGFNKERIISHGMSGIVYSGILKMKEERQYWKPQKLIERCVVIKKMGIGSINHKIREHLDEMNDICMLRHENLVRFIGLCHAGNYLLLVHEYIPNGSLRSHLDGQVEGSPVQLKWEVRYWKIVLGLASALNYLQRGWKRCIVHRAIKPSNILLDNYFNPKLTDFESGWLTKCDTAKMPPHVAPEAIGGEFSTETDIYAFGIVSLEIACGGCLVESSEKRDDFINWIRQNYEKRNFHGVADRNLGGTFNAEEMERLLLVGLRCTEVDPKSRPTIEEILLLLNSKDLMPPTLPSVEQEAEVAESYPGTSAWTNIHIAMKDDGLEVLNSGEEISWDIGVPSEHNLETTGHAEDEKHLILNAFVSRLEKIMLKSDKERIQFDELLDSIRKHTSYLVQLGAPLHDWNSLAQEVLRVSKDMDDFLNPTETLMSLRSKINKQTSSNEADGTMLNYIKNNLAHHQELRCSLMAKVADLNSQIKKAENEVKVLQQRITQRLELIRKSSTILSRYEGALSKVSSFESSIVGPSSQNQAGPSSVPVNICMEDSSSISGASGLV